MTTTEGKAMKLATLAVAVTIAILACCPALAGKRACPVIFSVMDNTAFLAGGVVDGKWMIPWKIAREMRGGETYRMYSQDKLLGTIVGEKPSEGNGRTGQHIVETKADTFPEDVWIAICGDWNALPRKPKKQSPMQKTYIDAVRSVVAQRGLRGSKVSIKEVWRVDLEGDGQDEVIVLAESREYDPGIYRQGQFSLVMLRKILDGRVKDLLLSNELHVKKPRFPGSLNGDEFPFQYWIDGFWDVDGDGTLEIVAGFSCMRTDYGGVDIWKLRKGKAYKLASEGVGF